MASKLAVPLDVSIDALKSLSEALGNGLIAASVDFVYGRIQGKCEMKRDVGIKGEPW